MIALDVMLAIVLAAIFAPLIAPADPLKGSMIRRLRPIGFPGYPLGSDELGRDMLTRLIYGGRLSLFIGVMPVLCAFVIGSGIGIFAGYLGGWINTLLMRIIDVFFAFPSVLLAIALSGALAPEFSTQSSRSRSCSCRRSRASRRASRPKFAPAITSKPHASPAPADHDRARSRPGQCVGADLRLSTSLISVSMILAAGLSFLGLG